MAPHIQDVEIRAAHPSEFDLLNDLILRSKAVWGYDDAFMEMCRDELQLSDKDLPGTQIGVADSQGLLQGVAQVQITDQDAELLKLFVCPELINSGVGRALFSWACSVARDGGAKNLMIESDPSAAPFYRHLGARDIGLAPSGSITGRMLPMLSFSLAE